MTHDSDQDKNWPLAELVSVRRLTLGGQSLSCAQYFSKYFDLKYVNSLGLSQFSICALFDTLVQGCPWPEDAGPPRLHPFPHGEPPGKDADNEGVAILQGV